MLELRNWMALVFTRGIWAFFPVILGVFLGYWMYWEGITENAVRDTFEVAAIWLMGAVVAVFLFRVIMYKLHTDTVMLVLSIGFLSREIHFAGTDTGVYVIAVIALSLAWIWRDRILDELDGKQQVKAAMFCMFWSYLVTMLIQRRVFSENRIAIFPDERLVHITLEEVTENVAHLAFLLVGLISFLYPRIIKKSD